MTTLKDRWKAFGISVGDPWVIILLIFTVALSIVLIRQTDVVIIAVFTFLVSIVSGVLGGIIAKRWDDITGERIIVARARSANRSLQLLLSSAIGLEKRVRLYIQRHNDLKYTEQVTPEVIKTYLEEIVENCLSLELNVINSIEDWTDIDPNLELKAVLSLIRDLNANYNNAQLQYEQVNAALQETKDKSEAEVKKLKDEKSQIQKNLSQIEKELREKSLQVGVPTISGSLITGSGIVPVFPSTSSSPTINFPAFDEHINFTPNILGDVLKGATVVDVNYQPTSKDKKDVDSKKEAKPSKRPPANE